jgi:acetyl esterase/lipase
VYLTIVKLFSLIVFFIFGMHASIAQCNGGRFDIPVFSQVTVTKNITYSTARTSVGGLQNILMDIFEPKDDTMQLRPLIIFMHGGAYWTGTKDYLSQIALGE